MRGNVHEIMFFSDRKFLMVSGVSILPSRVHFSASSIGLNSFKSIANFYPIRSSQSDVVSGLHPSHICWPYLNWANHQPPHSNFPNCFRNRKKTYPAL